MQDSRPSEIVYQIVYSKHNPRIYNIKISFSNITSLKMWMK